MQFDFDEEIDRRQVPALKMHRMVLGADGLDLFPAGVADMDFRVAPAILEAMQQRLEHGVFGYETVPSGLFPALIDWFGKRHSWQVDSGHILRAPNVLNGLATAASLFTRKGDGIIVQPRSRRRRASGCQALVVAVVVVVSTKAPIWRSRSPGRK
jgi:cystathionine beta-lyase